MFCGGETKRKKASKEQFKALHTWKHMVACTLSRDLERGLYHS